MKISDKENRIARFLPDESDEGLLRAVNQRLAETPKPGPLPEHPILFVSGGPRSGTTFMAQTVCRYLEVDYVDNLASKFWLAPHFGLRLSRMVFGKDKSGSFTSEYGRTSGGDIHSFHYFWMRHLKLENVDDLFSSPKERGVDWGVINAHLAAMQHVGKRAFAFKGYYPSYFMADFADNVPGSIFILIERDPLAQALSIYQARKDYNNDTGKWWSMQPPGLADLLELPHEEQIAGQVMGLREFFKRQISEAKHQPCVVRVSYDALVKDPDTVLRDMKDEIDRLCGHEIKTRGAMPEIREDKTVHPAPLVEKMKKALEKF